MSLPIYARPMYFGPIGINETTLAIALVVFGIALFLKLRHKQTKAFRAGPTSVSAWLCLPDFSRRHNTAIFVSHLFTRASTV